MLNPGPRQRESSMIDNFEVIQGGLYRPPQISTQQELGLDRGLWLLSATVLRREGWRRVQAHGLLNAAHLIRIEPFPLGKRVFDLFAAALLLLALAPLLLLIALAVVLDSPGPALFQQERIGEHGRSFRLWKFRSMYATAPKYARSPTSSDDPRMTRVGRIIRRLSLDELPQLVNVLRGEMTLVGPRPEMPFLVARYTPLQRRRLEARPGITGLWQISEGRLAPIHENLQYDLHYLRHRNVILDAAILIRTAAVVLTGKETV